MPTVSVVIPAYNASGTIIETLSSLAAQTFGDFEAVVVNDGSTDRTAQMVNLFGDSRIRVLTIPNGGVANARNRGIADTNGEFVAFLDADDLWAADKLAVQLDALSDMPAAGLCVSGAHRIDVASQVTATTRLARPDDVCVTLLLKAMAVGYISSGLARRSVLEAAGPFNPKFSYCADWDLWLRLSLRTEYAIVPDPLISYRTSAGNMSSDGALLERDTFAVLDEFFRQPEAASYLGIRRRAYSNHWMFCSGSYLHQGKRLDAARCLARGVVLSPANLRRPLGMPKRRLTRVARRTRSETP